MTPVMTFEIFSRFHHILRVSDKLVLRNQVFPYPPFTTYEWTVSSTSCVKVVKDCATTDKNILFEVGEGGSARENVIFVFNKPGIFSVTVDELRPGREYENKIFKSTLFTVMVDE
jgi:hypothetical protein